MKDLLLITSIVNKNPCYMKSPVLQIIGWVLILIKIVVPLIIIIIGLVKLFKHIKKKDSKIYVKSLIKRVVISLVIIVLPNILIILYGIIKYDENMISIDKEYHMKMYDLQNNKSDYYICYQCLTKPYAYTCDNAVGCSTSVDCQEGFEEH